MIRGTCLQSRVVKCCSCFRLHQVLRQYRGVQTGGGGNGQGEDQSGEAGLHTVQGPDCQSQAVAGCVQVRYHGILVTTPANVVSWSLLLWPMLTVIV